MSCPYCNSPVLLNDWAGNHWYKCGTTKTFRSESCVDREPIATDLRNALARIKRLEEFARTIEKDFDHDEDAHRYGTTCRVCDAEDLLKETKAKEAKL